MDNLSMDNLSLDATSQKFGGAGDTVSLGEGPEQTTTVSLGDDTEQTVTI